MNYSADEVYSVTTKGSCTFNAIISNVASTRSPTSRSGSTDRALAHQPLSSPMLQAIDRRVPRHRIDATTRQQHEALWTSRTSVDKHGKEGDRDGIEEEGEKRLALQLRPRAQ